MKSAVGVIFAFVLVYLLLVGFVYFFQHKMIFFPEKLSSDFRFRFRGQFVEKFLLLNGGTKIHYVVFTPEEKRGILLYFHGNAGSISSWGHVAHEIASRFSWEVWIVDYPGYGKSDGPLPSSEKELLETAQLLLHEAKKNLLSQPLVAYGRSLGSGLATHLAKDSSVAGLILETPYTSIKSRALEIYPIFPSFVVKYDLNNIDTLKEVKGKPISVIHGDADEVIPYHHALHLQKAHPHIHLVSIPKAGHNNIVEFTAYWKHLSEFLSLLNLRP